jgi:hypothetical protein
MKLAALTSKPRKPGSRGLRLLIVAGALALTLGAYAGTAGAATPKPTTWNYYDSGRGSCRLRDMGSLGSGGNSTITDTGLNLRNTDPYWVTTYKWTIVIDAVTGDRLAEYYVGSVNVSPNGGWAVFQQDTRDIPPRSVSHYHPVKIQDVVAIYPYGTTVLEEVDTFTASSYWIYHNTGYFHDNIPALSC